MASAMEILLAACFLVVKVVGYWYQRLRQRWSTKSPSREWFEALRNAEVFEDWEHAALQLDNIHQLNLWRNDPISQSYDWRLINNRTENIIAARESGNIQSLMDMIRAGLVRNLAHITAPRLFNRSFAGTKYLIEEYIAQVAAAIKDIDEQIALPIDDLSANEYTITTQIKLNFLHDSRQALGRTTLVLQGGAMFGLFHLGVIKALFLRGLLPRIITGTATGALIATLVAIHTDDELPAVLRGDGIDLSSFIEHENRMHESSTGKSSFSAGFETLMRRLRRFWHEGHILDVKVLEDCVKDNVGDMTFEEAYIRSKRVLNITVATEPKQGIPTLLNYLTAPHVLIRTAAVASNAASPTLYGSKSTTVLCKDEKGNIVPWAPATPFRHWTSSSEKGHKAPMARIAQLFNVNHFIVSQARPYLIPFLRSDMHGPSLVYARHRQAQVTDNLIRIVGLEIRHRLKQLDTLGLLPPGIRRFLVDLEMPGPTMLLVPKVTMGDFTRLLDIPTRENLDYWIDRGERSVWPAVTALKVRCAAEYEIDRAYQRARSLKAGGLRRKASTAAASDLLQDSTSASTGQPPSGALR
ncbi:acyl transferase/acyl hydrolase/lysophospholipase [Microdochium bolleyi]|uniref:Acyl transferase/acyl hydrolase/lysophospholipase n=1 Tax=Microdochium bolleyi TaxID=196109 RepID=A0A136JFT9_9PEZI|nr:acyl transferase/acyl hydrolase/lysophospholipase [Microdochium bolleyi]